MALKAIEPTINSEITDNNRKTTRVFVAKLSLMDLLFLTPANPFLPGPDE
jgi:hypothetical protein